MGSVSSDTSVLEECAGPARPVPWTPTRPGMGGGGSLPSGRARRGGRRLPTLRKGPGVRGDHEHCRASVADSFLVCRLSLWTAADGHKAAAESLLCYVVPADPCKISGRKVCVCCCFLVNEEETTQRVPHYIVGKRLIQKFYEKCSVFL